MATTDAPTLPLLGAREVSAVTVIFPVSSCFHCLRAGVELGRKVNPIRNTQCYVAEPNITLMIFHPSQSCSRVDLRVERGRRGATRSRSNQSDIGVDQSNLGVEQLDFGVTSRISEWSGMAE